MYTTTGIAKLKGCTKYAVIQLIRYHPEIQIDRYMTKLGGMWLITEDGKNLLLDWKDGRRKFD